MPLLFISNIFLSAVIDSTLNRRSRFYKMAVLKAFTNLAEKKNLRWSLPINKVTN